MELSKKLRGSGWHITEEGIKILTSVVGEDPDPRKLIDEALNRDLRDIGGGALPVKRDDGSGTLTGRIVLQVQKVRNIAAPKCNEESKAAPRLLQLELSDGQTTLQALELEPVSALSLNVAPGTKIYFRAEKLQLLHGFLLLKPNDLEILGGRVDALYEKWEFTRTMLKYARSGRPQSGTTAPPPWVAFGKAIEADADRDFKSLTSNADKDKPSKENDEFNNMRSEAIAVASKAGVKKVFGGGGQNILDHNIKKILEKGFSKEDAKDALQATRNNLERALYNLKRRKDAADGVVVSHVRGGRGERPGREGKRGATLKEEAESAKPAANATLFDFLTTKLPTTDVGAGTTAEPAKTVSIAEKPIVKQYESNFKPSTAQFSEHKSHGSGERTRFENNVSSSFAANRGEHSGRSQRGGARGRGGRDDRPPRGGGNSYNERGGGGSSGGTGTGGAGVGERGANLRRQETNPRASEQTHGRTTYRNGNENSAPSKSVPDSKQEIPVIKDQGVNRRTNERPNRNGVTRAENGPAANNNNNNNNNHNSNNNNRRRQQGNGSSGAPGAPTAPVVPPVKTTSTYSSNNDEYNGRLNKVITETTNLKLTSSKREHRRGGRQNSGRQPSEPQEPQKPADKTITTQRPQKVHQENARQPSNISCTQLPNGYTYDPSKIMGFQTKEANEFAMSLLKSQGLTIAAPNQMPTQSPPTIKQVNNVNPENSYSPSYAPTNPQPIAVRSPPQTFGMSPSDAWIWKCGDLCMAKYWDDGRYYEAEITAVSENTCVVFFLGYGNHEEVLKSDILPITDAQNRPLTNIAQSQHSQPRPRPDRQVHQQQVYVPPHKREY